ncbi:MAG: hypothetical protein WCH75_05440, partial [Candidatus Binatia bacterium]
MPSSSRLVSVFGVIQAVATVAEPPTSDPNTAAICTDDGEIHCLLSARDMARTDGTTVSAGPLPIMREAACACTLRVPAANDLAFHDGSLEQKHATTYEAVSANRHFQLSIILADQNLFDLIPAGSG